MNTIIVRESFLSNTYKWLVLCLVIGLLSGMASALFLVSLQFVTNYREAHLWLLWFMPIGGLMIGYFYHYFGKKVIKGNNLILEEYENPKYTIPLKMAPLILISTLLTHFFGGSAGREGTAVQVSSAIADQFSKIFYLTKAERRTLLIIGIAAGFASVFGTPLAGAIFAIEVLFFSKVNYRSLLPAFVTAFVAFYTVEILHVQHTHYTIYHIPAVNLVNLVWTIPVGFLCGLTAMLFSRTTHIFETLFSKNIGFPPIRPFLGGIILSIAFYVLDASKFSGLGVSTITEAFKQQSGSFDFLWKLLFTCFTLGAGFKGGEVTPLFFIGATLGSALSGIIPLPIALLAGMGFVAVFSGATHTPVACTVMGMELFGIDCGIYIGITCLIAYFSSGSIGVYRSQIVKGPKQYLYKKLFHSNFKNL